MSQQHSQHWSVDDSARLYGIRDWGRGFFGLNAAGEVTVEIPGDQGPINVSLMEIIDGLQQRGHTMPLVLRIENLLQARIAYLNDTFRHAIAAAGYGGEYRGVYPVKVNQQCQVVEEISHFGRPYHHGLEAGSKAELTLALANLAPGGLLILNGYKDRDFIDLGLWAHKLGHACFFVIESAAELDLLLERSARMEVRPNIGARIKVSAQVSGMWTETSGDRSSFGLSATQLLAMVETLKQHDRLDCLKLLHCHLGSQIPSLDDIRAGVEEACRYYASLVDEGAPMGYLDLGGGLAVDYSGDCSGAAHSRNYSLEQYCQAVVEEIARQLPGAAQPTIITESGRATVAYSSILLFNILDVMHFEADELPARLPAGSPEVLHQQFALDQQAETMDLAESYQQALLLREQMRQQFKQGRITLRQRVQGENLFLATARRVVRRLDDLEAPLPALDGVRETLADIYYGNFSVFQSLPDTWAIDQLFPVMPLHRHQQCHSRQAIISDLTCDCDGKLDHFVVAGQQQKTLPLHPLADGQEYYLGVFLMGAYQETLGDLHNLFGDTHVASVRINGDGGFDVIEEISGDTISEILSAVEYHPATLLDRMRRQAEQAVRQGQLTIAERQRFLGDYSARLNGYPYFQR